MAIDAVGLGGIGGHYRLTPEKIDSLSYWLQMLGPHAHALTAEVIDLKIVWDRFHEEFPGVPMGID